MKKILILGSNEKTELDGKAQHIPEEHFGKDLVVLVTDTIMKDKEGRLRLAAEVLTFAGSVLS